jgi:alpha-glucosidase
MTNESARRLTIPLDFLGDGVWRATIYADGPAAPRAWQTPVAMSERTVRRGESLELLLGPSGGQAILFEPFPV